MAMIGRGTPGRHDAGQLPPGGGAARKMNGALSMTI
jgi:hypothetical protein